MRNRFLIKAMIVTSLLVSFNLAAKQETSFDLESINKYRDQLRQIYGKENIGQGNKALLAQGYEGAALGPSLGFTTGSPPASTIKPFVSNVNPSEGAQHLRFEKDPAFADGVAIGDFVVLPEITDLTVSTLFSVDFNLTSGNPDYVIFGIANNGGNFDTTFQVNFSYLGDIRVVDDIGAGLVYVDTGTNYTNGVYQTLTVIADPATSTIRYFLDGGLIYTGVAALGSTALAGTVIDAIQVQDDNYTEIAPGDFDYFFFDTDLTSAVLDLSLTKSNDAMGQLAMGDTVNYTLTVDNIGTGGSSINFLGTSSNIVVTDTLPAGMTFVSASCDDGTTGSFSAPNVTMSLNDIDAGNNTVCTVVATVGDFGVHVNNASVSSNGDTDNTNDTASSSVTGPNEVDMSIVKTSNAVGQVAENATVIYTLAVTNNDGTDAASSVVVTDVLPMQVTHVSNDCGAGVVAGTLTWNAGAVAAGASDTCNVTVTVTGFGTFGNTATVVAFETDNTPANNTSSTNVQGPTAPAGVDLILLKTSNAVGEQAANATVTYTLLLSNNSANPSTGTEVVDVLPAELSYVSNTCGASEVSGTVTWNIGNLAANSNISCDIVTTVSGLGNISNTASANSNEIDNNTTNNSGTAVIQGPPAVDLSISKTSNAASVVQIGETIIYTITVDSINTGPATGVVVTDALPVELLYVSNSCGATEAAGVVTWTIGNLSPGSSISCNITTILEASGTVVNIATVSSNEVDIVLGNNSGGASIFSGAIIPTLSTLSLLLLILLLSFYGRKMLIKG